MKHLVFILGIILSYSNLTIAQETDEEYIERIQAATKQVAEINADSIAIFMIFLHQIYEGKGFLIDNNIPARHKTKTPVTVCRDSIDQRAIIQPIDDNLFKVKYKWKQSNTFHTDTCAVYTFNDADYVAFTIDKFPDHKTKAKNIFVGLGWAPASTDDREVLKACKSTENTVILYHD